MDANNFVGASGNGYDVYVNGQKVGTYGSLTDAQNAYNNRLYGSSSTAGAATPATSSSAGSLQALLDAIATGDTAKFNEAIRQYNATTNENARQFDIGNATKQREDYSGLGTSLLDLASKLRGPQDYYQYQQALSGGRDLMSQLYGNNPRATFSTPVSSTGVQGQGAITPISISSLMSSLGFNQAPQMPTATWSPTNNNWNIVPAPPAGTSTPVYDKGGKVPGQAGGHIIAILQAGEKVIPAKKAAQQQGRRKGPTRYTKEGVPIFDAGGTVPSPYTPASNVGNVGMEPTKAGYAPVTPENQSSSIGAMPQPISNWATALFAPQQSGPASASDMGPVMPATNNAFSPNNVPAGSAPLPYQVNPAVFDRLGITGQGLLRSLVESQGWDWNDYLGQLNAQRPQGTAPAYSIMSYFTPGSTRTSTEGMFGVY